MEPNNRMEVFSDGYDSITSQPSTSFGGIRRPLPVSVIDVEASQTSCFTPIHGLDFLRDSESFIIQQTVELSDLMSEEESENRFNIKVQRGDTIYTASESSTGCQRGWFGSSRSYHMRIYDRSQQNVMEFQRRLACGACNFWCYLQRLEVHVHPGEYLGCIQQKFGLLKTNFEVMDRNDNVIYTIVGPDSFGCLLGKNHTFTIYSNDGLNQVGTIIHRWDQIENSYNILVETPQSCESRKRALLLGAAFLLEYMYYENMKKSSLRCIC